MGIVRSAKPVKLIAAIMAVNTEKIADAAREMQTLFGDIDLKSDIFSFSHSHYYRKEMGDNLVKQFFSFAPLVQIDLINHIKLTCNNIEIQLSRNCEIEAKICRRVNIDPGYISPAKLVLATTKNYDHRIYIGQGIYAEVTLHYTKNRFQPWPWTYPDYQTDLSINFFKQVRAIYFQQLDTLGVQKIENVETE